MTAYHRFYQWLLNMIAAGHVTTVRQSCSHRLLIHRFLKDMIAVGLVTTETWIRREIMERFLSRETG